MKKIYPVLRLDVRLHKIAVGNFALTVVWWLLAILVVDGWSSAARLSMIGLLQLVSGLVVLCYAETVRGRRLRFWR